MDEETENVTHVPNLLHFHAMEPDDYNTPATVPIIIDNGCTTYRFGFSNASAPYTIPNIYSRYRERKHNLQIALFGDNVEVESGAKTQSKTAWEGDILINFDAMENALDYAFCKLGLNTDSVLHPVVISERLCTPMYSRSVLSELLFEGYNVPRAAFAIDALMSFYHNTPNQPKRDGVVVSFNSASTSIIPVLNGKGILANAKRMPWGANQASEYLLKLVQMKYPYFPTRVTSQQSAWMLRTFCEVSPNYVQTLRELSTPEGMRVHDRIVQFPFVAPEEKTQEELARQAERKREAGRRLQEMAIAKRKEKMETLASDLAEALALKERMKSGEVVGDALDAELERLNYDDVTHLNNALKNMQQAMKRARKKEGEMDEEEELSENSLREKRKQKLMKANSDARKIQKAQRMEEKRLKEEEALREQGERDRDLTAWSNKIRSQHETIMQRMQMRKRQRAALLDRKSAASQSRMKNVASLAVDIPGPRKRRKGNEEDTFGADDEDWQIYRKINTGAPDESEEEDLVRLAALEKQLLEHDPTFSMSQTYASLSTARSKLLEAFRPAYAEEDVRGHARIHLNVERYRCVETWFSPGIAGCESAGLGEVLQFVLSRFKSEQRLRMAKNVFLTGAPAQFPGLSTRIHAAVQEVLEPGAEIDVRVAKDPALDAWYGMARFSETDEFAQIGITRALYDEHGPQRVIRWWGSNWV
ncbi:Nuclear actin-protein involved in chromatin remodeling [Serendipita sp. 399]|nr:Nuclear actin-protein involved in chromatin remodeling [Serendipita sp. 399]